MAKYWILRNKKLVEVKSEKKELSGRVIDGDEEKKILELFDRCMEDGKRSG